MLRVQTPVVVAIEERRRSGEVRHGGIIVVEDLLAVFISERNYKDCGQCGEGCDFLGYNS